MTTATEEDALTRSWNQERLILIFGAALMLLGGAVAYRVAKGKGASKKRKEDEGEDETGEEEGETEDEDEEVVVVPSQSSKSTSTPISCNGAFL